ncbi:hypothetical protein RFI_17954, partial [Reticulomyxa filosa]
FVSACVDDCCNNGLRLNGRVPDKLLYLIGYSNGGYMASELLLLNQQSGKCFHDKYTSRLKELCVFDHPILAGCCYMGGLNTKQVVATAGVPLEDLPCIRLLEQQLDDQQKKDHVASTQTLVQDEDASHSSTIRILLVTGDLDPQLESTHVAWQTFSLLKACTKMLIIPNGYHQIYPQYTSFIWDFFNS